ncbi:MAG: hypothetical protein WEB60_08605 [Terrimicrobiaceae bacterium]
MSAISELKWTGNFLSWCSNEGPKEISFHRQIANALLLRSNGIAVVEGNDLEARALILNSDGSIRAILKNPFNPEQAQMFYYFNYEGTNLVVILAGTTRDFACEVDETTGVLSLPRETR